MPNTDRHNNSPSVGRNYTRCRVSAEPTPSKARAGRGLCSSECRCVASHRICSTSFSLVKRTRREPTPAYTLHPLMVSRPRSETGGMAHRLSSWGLRCIRAVREYQSTRSAVRGRRRGSRCAGGVVFPAESAGVRFRGLPLVAVPGGGPRFEAGSTRLDAQSRSNVLQLARDIRDGRHDGRGPANANRDLAGARAGRPPRSHCGPGAGVAAASLARNRCIW